MVPKTSGEDLTAAQVRSMYRGHAAVGNAVIDLINRNPGWRARKQGHKLRLYCRCLAPAAQFSIPGTPRNDQIAASWILQTASRHELNHLPPLPATTGNM
jgi:hypothetical protein